MRSISVHPNYNSRTVNNDFAVLRLRSAINLDGSSKAAISLPGENEAIATNLKVYVSGWGATQNRQESDRYLRGAEITVINPATCNSAWRGGITDRMVCASAPGKSSCFVGVLKSIFFRL